MIYTILKSYIKQVNIVSCIYMLNWVIKMILLKEMYNLTVITVPNI